MATGSSKATSPNTELDEDDLGALYEALYPARNSYKSIGLLIGVKIGEIENIESNKADSGDRLLAVLSVRLNKAEPLTWNEIDSALRSECVNKSRLADKLRQKYDHLFIPESSTESEQEHEIKSEEIKAVKMRVPKKQKGSDHRARVSKERERSSEDEGIETVRSAQEVEREDEEDAVLSRKEKKEKVRRKGAHYQYKEVHDKERPKGKNKKERFLKDESQSEPEEVVREKSKRKKKATHDKGESAIGYGDRDHYSDTEVCEKVRKRSKKHLKKREVYTESESEASSDEDEMENSSFEDDASQKGSAKRKLTKHKPNTELGEDDLGALYEALYPARNSYKSIGLLIGVKIGEIEIIESNKTDPGDRLLAILSVRVKKAEPLTWNDIYNALISKCIDESKLAKEIWAKHLFIPESSTESESEQEREIMSEEIKRVKNRDPKKQKGSDHRARVSKERERSSEYEGTETVRSKKHVQEVESEDEEDGVLSRKEKEKVRRKGAHYQYKQVHDKERPKGKNKKVRFIKDESQSEPEEVVREKSKRKKKATHDKEESVKGYADRDHYSDTEVSGKVRIYTESESEASSDEDEMENSSFDDDTSQKGSARRKLTKHTQVKIKERYPQKKHRKDEKKKDAKFRDIQYSDEEVSTKSAKKLRKLKKVETESEEESSSASSSDEEFHKSTKKSKHTETKSAARTKDTSEYLLRCFRSLSIPDEKQMLWMGNERANTEPTLPQLMRLKLPEKVGGRYRKFGTLLLNDDTGCLVDIEEKSCHYQPDDIVTSILRKWLQEEPTPVTWDNLIQVLRDCGLKRLADCCLQT